MEIIGMNRLSDQQRVADPGRRPTSIDEAGAGEADREKRLPAVGPDDHTLETLDRGIAIERKRRLHEPLQRFRSRHDRLEPRSAGRVCR